MTHTPSALYLQATSQHKMKPSTDDSGWQRSSWLPWEIRLRDLWHISRCKLFFGKHSNYFLEIIEHQTELKWAQLCLVKAVSNRDWIWGAQRKTAALPPKAMLILCILLTKGDKGAPFHFIQRRINGGAVGVSMAMVALLVFESLPYLQLVDKLAITQPHITGD